jgi:Spy/CpxP family protein refolding chaperone
MKNMRKFLLMAVLVLGLFALPLAYAEDNGPAVPEHKTFCHKAGRKVCDIYSQLNLTDQQKKQLDESRNKYREQNKTLFNQIKEKGALIRQELQKDKLDMNKINQANSELKKIEGQLLDSRLQGMLETKKILTPEQFKKLMAEKEEGMSHNMMAKHGWMAERGISGIKGKGEMVAAQDGGVIVMKGNMLYKYDKDLNLTKEVELKKKEASENKDTVENAEPQGVQEEAGE